MNEKQFYLICQITYTLVRKSVNNNFGHWNKNLRTQFASKFAGLDPTLQYHQQFRFADLLSLNRCGG